MLPCSALSLLSLSSIVKILIKHRSSSISIGPLSPVTKVNLNTTLSNWTRWLFAASHALKWCKIHNRDDEKITEQYVTWKQHNHYRKLRAQHGTNRGCACTLWLCHIPRINSLDVLIGSKAENLAQWLSLRSWRLIYFSPLVLTRLNVGVNKIRLLLGNHSFHF